MDIEDTTDGEPLDLAEFPEADEEPETIITFADEGEGEDETQLVKNLRAQLRERDRRLAEQRRNPTPANDTDPEPVVPPLKRSDDEEFGWDPDRHAEYIEKRDAQIVAHTEWKRRQDDRTSARQRQQDDQAKQIEQKRHALGVSDYAERVATVKDRLTDEQMAVLINAADDAPRLLYALSRSESRLDMLAGIDNLARFAAQVGILGKEVKVSKRIAPAPETRVVGATASVVAKSDKTLERLEAEADKSGDRSKVIAYKRAQRKAAA